LVKDTLIWTTPL